MGITKLFPVHLTDAGGKKEKREREKIKKKTFSSMERNEIYLRTVIS